MLIETSSTQESRIFNVQKTRFCNLWELPTDHVFTEEFLKDLLKRELTDTITYNDHTTAVTFSMKYLAKEVLRYEYKLYIP